MYYIHENEIKDEGRFKSQFVEEKKDETIYVIIPIQKEDIVGFIHKMMKERKMPEFYSQMPNFFSKNNGYQRFY